MIYALGQSTRSLFQKSRLRIRGLEIRINRARFRHKTSAPYISGDAIADCVEYAPLGKNGEILSPDVEKLRLARSLFVPAHLLDDFVEKYSLQITATVLVTGNSDRNFVAAPRLPSTVRMWIGQNLAIGNEARPGTDIFTLPIGLENLALGRSGNPKYFKMLSSLVVDRVFVPPMAPSNPVRRDVLDTLGSSTGRFEVQSEYVHQRAYFKMANRYRFVLCLEGNGFENHRIWETLYRNGFPVMFRTPWSITLQNLGLPILFINNLDDCSDKVLLQFESENKDFNSHDYECLWIPYWSNLIIRGENYRDA